MNAESKTNATLAGLSAGFVVLTVWFLLGSGGRPAPLPEIPLVALEFTNTATVRVSGAELIRTGGDASGLDCYACHDRNKPSQLHFDPEGNPVLPDEHKDIVMGHGRHHRNNNCFNCHNETNLDLLQTRDGRSLKLVESTPLCGSCHGPTYRDWSAGAHGRISGHWKREVGASVRADCVSCHDPHAPRFPPQKAAPGPHPLHGVTAAARTGIAGGH